MKSFLIRSALIAAPVFAILYFMEVSSPVDPPDLIDLVDAVIDAGLESSPDLSSPAFLERRLLVITTDVNAAFSKALVEKLILLDRHDSSRPIDLYLRTEGGWEADAYAVIDTISAIRSPVNVHGMGEVHSAGAMILASATGRRLVYPNTILGFHALTADEGELFEERYLTFWEAHAQLPGDWLERRDGELLFFTPQEAVEMGVADEIVEPDRVP